MLSYIDAVKQGRTEVIEDYLLNHYESLPEHTLTASIKYVHQSAYLVNLLLDRIHERGLIVKIEPKKKISLAFDFIDTKNDAKLKLLLDNGVDVKSTYKMNSMLGHAISAGNVGAVRVLIEAGADLHQPGFLGQLPLTDAASEGKLEIVKLLVEHGARIDEVTGEDGSSGSAIVNAALEGHLDVVLYLLSQNANPNLAYLSWNNDQSDDESNDGIDDWSDSETFEEAPIQEVEEDAVESQVPQQPGKQWRTALDAAADQGYTDIIEALLKHPVKSESRTHINKLDFTSLNKGNALTIGTSIRNYANDGNTEAVEELKPLIAGLDWQDEEKTASNVAHMLGCFSEHKDVFRDFMSRVPEDHIVAVGRAYVQIHKHAKAKGLEMSLKQFLQEQGHADLIPMFETDADLYELEETESGKFNRKPKIREELLQDQALKLITTLQKIIGGRHANRKVSTHVGIDLVEASDRNAKYGESSAAQALPNTELQQLRAAFFKLAQQVPYYMKHALSDPAIFDVILQDGTLLSQDRVQNVKGIKSKGLNTESDQANQSHYYTYHSAGTIKDQLPTPKSLDSTTNPEFIMNVDHFLASEPLHADHLVVKGEDWGAQHERTIDLGNGMNIRIKFESAKPDKVHSTDSKIHYTYSDEEGETRNYTFLLSDEVAVGTTFKKATASFIMRHFDHLPEKAQLHILQPLKDAMGLEAPREQELQSKQAVADVFQRFYFMEASIGGSMPLDIRYTDSIRKPREADQETENSMMQLGKLRESILLGEITDVMFFFEQHPEAAKIPFIVKSSLDLARQMQHAELVEWLNRMYIEHIDPHKGISVIPREVTDIHMLQQLILENRSEYTKTDFTKDKLRFTTKLNPSRRDDGTHSAAITALAGALGNTHYMAKDSLDMPMDQLEPLSDFVVELDGQEHDPDSPLGHGAFQQAKDVRNAMLRQEMETLLTSAQNESYFLQHGELHPVTGKGATESTVLNRKDKLQDYSLELLTTEEDYVQIIVKDTSTEQDKLELVSATLSKTLGLANTDFDTSGQRLTIKLPVREVLQRMLSAKINYQGVVPFDENGNILLAERAGEERGKMGLSTSGGHNSNNYHPFSGAMTELEEENALKLRKGYPLTEDLLISRTGPYRDVAVIALPFEAYESMEAGREHQLRYQEKHAPKQLPVPFKAEESEFALFSEEILAHHEMRGRRFREVMPLEDIVAWEERQLQKRLSNGAFGSMHVTIDAACKLETLENDRSIMVKYKVPQASFGTITFQLSADSSDGTDTITNLIRFLKELDAEANIIQQDATSVKVDHINPLKIVKFLT
ncbi:ankyrin repeat domain-containing protein [Paenibacillus sp. 1P07SE]|uniref:ankyrin repeat domain-containing protein n=1 Tax=Paenibacillus sp. 1P07SE TaxID=3132209 RepID=UPI0039A5D6C2